MKKVVSSLFFSLSILTLGAMPAPDFTVTTSEGAVRKLYQDYINAGKIVVVKAFFTTCPPCSSHAPAFESLYQSLKATYPGKVEFILLSTSGSDNNAKLNQYKTSKNLTMPACGSEGGAAAALQPYVQNQFGSFYGTPTFWVIAPWSGQVTFDIRGNSIAQTMEKIQLKVASLVTTSCSISRWSGDPLPGVSLQVQLSNGTQYPIPVTGTQYRLDTMPGLTPTLAGAGTYTLVPAAAGNPLDGVSTFDLLLISKHILSIQPFNQEWQLLAADVNLSGTITTFDIVNIRKVILGIENQLPEGNYRFVGSNGLTAQHAQCVAIKGVKMGDVSGPQLTDTQADDRSLPRWLMTDDQVVVAGRKLRIPLIVRQATTLEGFQLGFHTGNLDITDVHSSLPGFSRDYIHHGNEFVRLSCLTEGAVTLQPGDTLLTLLATAKQSGQLADMLQLDISDLIPQCFDGNQCFPLDLYWVAGRAGFRVHPNPAKNGFFITFEAPTEGLQSLSLYHPGGTLIGTYDFEAAEGYNRIWIPLMADVPGIYFGKMTDGSTNKIIFVR
jgi:peroxiredoxin